MTRSLTFVGKTESAEPPRALTVDVVHEAGDWSAVDPDVETAILKAADAVARAPAARVRAGMNAVVALADDVTVRRLNGTYRAKDKPTNVLSFPSGDANGRALGDVVLALETICAEADDLGLCMRHHTQHLVVHGLLHLLGFDHETDREATAMECLETEILASIGLADPYADAGPVPAEPA